MYRTMIMSVKHKIVIIITVQTRHFDAYAFIHLAVLRRKRLSRFLYFFIPIVSVEIDFMPSKIKITISDPTSI